MAGDDARGSGIKLFILLGITFAGIWWLLTDGAPGSWIIGLPTVIAATWTAQRLQVNPPLGISIAGILRFLPLFAYESLRGGIDVTLRTLSPKMRITPGFARYDSCLEQEGARIFFLNCVSLLPGTLAADLNGTQINLHLLDKDRNPESDLRRLEHAVGRIYNDFTSGRDSHNGH